MSQTKSDHQLSVEEFMRNARQDVPDDPILPNEVVRLLRARLIFEEAKETIAALGFELHQNKNGEFDIQEADEPSLIEIIDGCCDIAVVTTGTLSACGICDLPFQSAINANNLAKFGPGYSWREDGKLIKPPGHKPPDIAAILKGLRQAISDAVNHPSHYNTGSIEVIDAIDDQKLDFPEGCVVKYVARYRHKNGIEDLKKARWYLDYLINREERKAKDANAVQK